MLNIKARILPPETEQLAVEHPIIKRLYAGRGISTLR